MNKQITDTSLALFLAYAADAGNWNGTPLIGGNVGGTNQQRGNLAQLKMAGLIETERDADNPHCAWIYFTPEGVALAAEHGIALAGT